MRYRILYESGYVGDPLDWDALLETIRTTRQLGYLSRIHRIIGAQDPLSRTTIFNIPALQGTA